MTGPHPLDEATGDVFLRWHVGADPRARMWRTGQAVAVVVPRGEALGCLAFGDPGQMAVATTEALTSLAAEGVTEVRLSLPPGVESPAAERVADVSRWEWMWISRLSSRQSPEVRWLDPADADLLDLLAQSPAPTRVPVIRTCAAGPAYAARESWSPPARSARPRRAPRTCVRSSPTLSTEVAGSAPR